MRRLAASLVLFGLLAACSERPYNDIANPPDSSETPVASPSSAGTATSSDGRTATAPGVTTRATAAPNPGESQPRPRTTAAIDRACVRRGVDTQGLTVRNARSGGYVGYSTEYSDHSNEVSNRSYTTGYGYGRTDSSGGYRATWVVPATAPAGIATLRVIYSASEQPIVLTFNVVAQTGSC